MVESDELRTWIQKALAFTASVPPKKTRSATKTAPKKPAAARSPIKQAAAKNLKSRARG